MNRNYFVKFSVIGDDCNFTNYYLTNKFEAEMLSTIIFYTIDPKGCCSGNDPCFRCDGGVIKYKSTKILDTNTEIEFAKELINDTEENKVCTLSELFNFIIKTDPKDVALTLMDKFVPEKIIISKDELYNSTIKIFYINNNCLGNNDLVRLLGNVKIYFQKHVLIILIGIICGYIDKDQFDDVTIEFLNKLFESEDFDIISDIDTTYNIDFYRSFSNNKKRINIVDESKLLKYLPSKYKISGSKIVLK